MKAKTCIWCRKNSSQVSFTKKAHTIPQSLGGTDVCINVCDECNHYFGSTSKNKPAIETVFKETFNVSRARFLQANNDFGKNKSMTHVKSCYFIIDFEKKHIDIKPALKMRAGYQAMLCRQFKRGLFKVFLEESERQYHNGIDKKFDFIREFSRYDVGDIPVLYFRRVHGAILLPLDEPIHPKFHFKYEMKYHENSYSFIEFEFLSHLFAIPIRPNYMYDFKEYIISSINKKSQFFYPPIQLNYLLEIDILLDVLNSK